MNLENEELDILVIEEENRQNVGPFDRMIRSGLGGALIGAVAASPGPMVVHQAMMVIVAIYPLLTAFIGWDPIYALYEDARAHARVSRRSMSFLSWLWTPIHALWLPVYNLLAGKERTVAHALQFRFADERLHDVFHRSAGL